VRICHFSSTSLEGAYFRHLSHGFAADGHTYHCGTLAGHPPPRWVAEAPPASYFALGTTDRRGWPAAAVRLARYLRRHRIDVLQTHLVHGALVGTMAAKLARIPLLVHMRHHIDDVRLTGRDVHVAVDRALAAAADEVVVPSHAAKRYLSTVEGIDPTHITVIHLGFDLDTIGGEDGDRERVRAELGLGEHVTLGCIARMSPNKGHSFLFEAVRDLAPEFPDVRLMLVGEGDPQPYREAARAAGIEGRTLFLGQRADVPACLRAMDVVVLPSLSESFSQVIIEALAAGRPLVATDVGGAREVIADADNALLVPARDSAALRDAIRRVLTDDDLRAGLAERGRPSVARFSVAGMVREHLELYERSLRGAADEPPGGQPRAASRRRTQRWDGRSAA
jgi:glycosyltransferase involved in cell wall biosynthesis